MNQLFDDYRKPAQTSWLILMDSRELGRVVAEVMGDHGPAQPQPLSSASRVQDICSGSQGTSINKPRVFSSWNVLSDRLTCPASLPWERLYLTGHPRMLLGSTVARNLMAASELRMWEYISHRITEWFRFEGTLKII